MIGTALAFTLKNFGLITSIIKEGITIGPDIVKLVNDGFATSTKIAEEDREPTAEEWAELNALEEYWRNRFHTD